LFYAEKPFVRNPEGANIPGVNVVTWRNSDVPLDSYIVSKVLQSE
jgi:hypothetical protein